MARPVSMVHCNWYPARAHETGTARIRLSPEGCRPFEMCKPSKLQSRYGPFPCSPIELRLPQKADSRKSLAVLATQHALRKSERFCSLIGLAIGLPTTMGMSPGAQALIGAGGIPGAGGGNACLPADLPPCC